MRFPAARLRCQRPSANGASGSGWGAVPQFGGIRPWALKEKTPLKLCQRGWIARCEWIAVEMWKPRIELRRTISSVGMVTPRFSQFSPSANVPTWMILVSNATQLQWS